MARLARLVGDLVSLEDLEEHQTFEIEGALCESDGQDVGELEILFYDMCVIMQGIAVNKTIEPKQSVIMFNMKTGEMNLCRL